MKYILTVIILFCFFVLQAQNPSLTWAKNTVNITSDAIEGKSIAVDALGNVYTSPAIRSLILN